MEKAPSLAEGVRARVQSLSARPGRRHKPAKDLVPVVVNICAINSLSPGVMRKLTKETVSHSLQRSE